MPTLSWTFFEFFSFTVALNDDLGLQNEQAKLTKNVMAGFFYLSESCWNDIEILMLLDKIQHLLGK